MEDIEAIRRELGIPKITLYGTSYGVKVALGYALTYPGNVERLVLDSVVEPGGQDPLYRHSLAAAPRVLRALCRSRCRTFTRDPLADLERLVRRMARRPLRGYVVDRRGRRRPARLTRGELFVVLLTGDFDPALRGAFPGAVRAALDGDTAPLLRLKRRALSVAAPPPPHVFSAAVFTATTCEESPLPWPRTTPPDPLERRRQTEAAVNATPSSAFLPFDRGAALENDLPRLCDRWAATPAPPDFGAGPAARRAGAADRGRGRPADAGGERAARGRAVPAGAAGGGVGHRALGARRRSVRLHGARPGALLPRPARGGGLQARAAALPGAAASAAPAGGALAAAGGLLRR